MRKHIQFILILCISLLTSCSEVIHKDWLTTQNDYLFWGIPTMDSVEYYWEGKGFEQVIHGEGILTLYKNDSVINQKHITVRCIMLVAKIHLP